ncbi:cadherin EGF LAG seven-pass G-type receptor 2-like [Sparus aurata]|uniref:cadherin EGF LAG seven-pass G-type receptor 2-like n=1 Tax=Sparus aurata TaxID=8175 RepID=UPI0011C12B9F|nr:cadherin EGF LAG seven-pass G-type receptor 2-like [Sparus aurata]
MDSGGLVRPCLLLFISICVCAVSGNPLYTSVIDCTTGSSQEFGPVDEGYEGDVELVTGIAAGRGVKLVPYMFDKHLEYLELSFMTGDTSVTIRTKKPLDADTLTDSGGILFYSIMCDGVIKQNNTRRLKISDINDNSPIFEEKLYSQNVSESEPVGFEVVRVTATDADITNNAITYSIEPASEVFEVTSAGAVRLKKRLNYNLVQQYNLIVKASDPLGLSDTATVVINVEDFDNLNPYFSHSLYRAFIPENQDGPFQTIEPEAIKAQDGDTGINVALIYSISEVSPAEYQSNFQIDSSSGVLTVQTPIDREEMNSSVISVNIEAAQTDDSLKTANAVVSVTIKDVNDNAPKFDRSNYSVSLLENSPVDAVVFRAVVTDLDQGGFVGTLRILPESAPFSISSDGTVRVKDSTALDRETTTSFTFQIEAAETNPPNNVATAEVNVTLLDENDNSPVFTSDTYEGKVFANQTEGMLLVQVEAKDVDDGANGQITYSIDFGNTDGYFSIEEKTGMIRLAKAIPLVEKRILEFPLYVTARDGGSVSRSTTAQVIIRALPTNEPPQFSKPLYEASIFSNAPYKTPVVTVEASDPDVGDQGRLVYSLEDTTYFDVDPSTGLVFVVSAVELAGQKVELKVHADDLQGLQATTTVEVTVRGNVSSSDVVVIRLNQPANTVENKIPDMESSLTNALGWTVDVIKVSNTNRRASGSRMRRAAVWTRVSFICLDGGTVVSGEEVTTKLQSDSEAVREELVKVFGDSVQFEVESEPQGPASNPAVAIAVGVLVPLIIVGLIVSFSSGGGVYADLITSQRGPRRRRRILSKYWDHRELLIMAYNTLDMLKCRHSS